MECLCQSAVPLIKRQSEIEIPGAVRKVSGQALAGEAGFESPINGFVAQNSNLV